MQVFQGFSAISYVTVKLFQIVHCLLVEILLIFLYCPCTLILIKTNFRFINFMEYLVKTYGNKAPDVIFFSFLISVTSFIVFLG
jgi:hypothetical protein